jgi:hypothetical protein
MEGLTCEGGAGGEAYTAARWRFNSWRFPDAVQRESGAPLIRDRYKRRVSNDPGSAAQHHSARKTRVNALTVPRCARDMC